MADPLSTTYDFTNGTTADGSQVTQNFDDIEGYINNRLGNLTNGQLLIANASGQVVGRVISGDITIDNLGVATIGNDKITAAMIQAGAVGASEIVTGAVGTDEIGSLPACIVGMTGVQVVADSTEVSVAFGVEDLDTDAMHDNSTNNDRLTVVTAGVYDLSGYAEFGADSDGRREVYIKRYNSAGVEQEVVAVGQGFAPSAVNNSFVGASGLAKAAAGDFFRFRVYHNAGGNLSVADARFSAAWQGDG
jgi:hypothetical protein